MTGPIVWCTGAGKGIGRALTLEYARRGRTVAASSRTIGDLQGVAAEAGDRLVRPYPLDVTDAAATAATVAAIETDLGPIDTAIFNAGTHSPSWLSEFSSARFRNLFETNVMGVVHGLDALLPRMRERRAGHIAVVASVAGYAGLPSAAAYGATKAALINMCEALKPELDRIGVRLSVVNPGFVRTPLTDRNPFPMPFLIEPDEAARRIADGIAAGRFEIAFPRRMRWTMKLLRALPYPLFFALTRRLVRD